MQVNTAGHTGRKGKLTGRFDLREEGAHLLSLHDVGDDVSRHLGVRPVGDDHRGPTLQRPQSRLHLATD